MADLKFDIDVQTISDEFGHLKEQVKEDLTKSAENLAAMTHAKTLELARDSLSSLSKMYTDNVEFSNPMPNLWVVTLKEPAMWIEEGRKSGFMEELLNGKSAKTNAKGEKYAIIPFKHNVNPTEQSQSAKALANQIKDALKKEGINWRKIEKNEDGSPRLGRLHTVRNPSSARQKPEHKGALTEGISVYQTKDKGGNVRRDVMTFRIITEKHRNEGLWIHPGRAGDKLMDKAFDWALEVWEREILPATTEKYGK